MRKVYENIDMLRDYKGITKRALAEKVGISEMQCNRFMWGESKIPVEMLPKFAFALDVCDLNIFFKDELTNSVIEKTEKCRMSW